MLSRVFTSSALLREPSKVAHELNAIGLCANIAIMVGVNPMFLVNASSVGFESAGTCSGVGKVILGIMISVDECSKKIKRGPAHRSPDGVASAPSSRHVPARRTAA